MSALEFTMPSMTREEEIALPVSQNAGEINCYSNDVEITLWDVRTLTSA